MPAGQLLEPSLTESSFLLSSLSEGYRVDGRSFTQTRDIQIEFGQELGNCCVSIKGTRVQTSVRASLIAPRSDRPYEGFLQITSDVSPMAGVEYDSTLGGGGASSSSARAREILFDRLLEKAIRKTEAVDRESLCVVAGEQVWNLHLTVHLLSDTGSALDTAVLCSLLSLRHFRRPDFSIENGNQVRLYSSDERVPIPLAIHHTPLCVTFAFFQLSSSSSNNEENESSITESNPDPYNSIPSITTTTTTTTTKTVVLLDPTLLEETLAHSKLILVLNAQREICVLDKAGGSPLDATLFLDLLQLAIQRVQSLHRLVEESLEKDSKARVVEVL